MKTLRRITDVSSVIKYSFIFFCFLAFSKLENDVLPYSSAIFVTSTVLGASLFITPLLYLGSFLILGASDLLLPACIFAGVILITVLIYRKFKSNYFIEIIAFTLIGLIGFILLEGQNAFITIEKRVLTVILTTVLTILTFIAGKAIKEKGLKFKFSLDQTACLLVCVALFGLGVCRLISPLAWKGVCALILLGVCYIYRVGICSILSTVLGLSLALFYNDVSYVGVFLVWSVSIECFLRLSRYAGALSLLICDYLIQVVFSVYQNYQVIDFICILIGCGVFCLIPSSILKNLKEQLYSFREKQLTRESINRCRSVLAGRLYDLSGVFTEMADAFTNFKKNNVTEESAKAFIQKQVVESVCKDCVSFSRCSSKNAVKADIEKLIDIGFAKGKLSLIDMPKDISKNCSNPNNILFALNKLLADYRLKLLEDKNLSSGRDLIASEALGVAEILRGLALETGSLVKYHNTLERKLCDELFKGGFNVNELLIYGENDLISVSLITAMNEFSLTGMQAIISKTLGVQMDLTDRNKITEDKCYLSFRRAVDFDAVFGVAKAVKDGSEKSGDTHSVIRINNNRFLMALSDGMGSGKQANAVSSASLSLIESFYKAGLDGNLILQTVNKLLAINSEDTFTALDVSIIDLKNCSADFIKYGAPYGFIINDNGIKIVEGNTLPLGILDQLKPSVATTSLDGGDMIVLVTDGITEAFSSSGEIIDYLRKVPAKNPQTLANGILEKALELSNGKKNDDMTVLAVRVFKKNAV